MLSRVELSPPKTVGPRGGVVSQYPLTYAAILPVYRIVRLSASPVLPAGCLLLQVSLARARPGRQRCNWQTGPDIAFFPSLSLLSPDRCNTALLQWWHVIE